MASHSSYGQINSGTAPTGNGAPQPEALQSDEIEEDDLTLLDIPDIPVDADCYGK